MKLDCTCRLCNRPFTVNMDDAIVVGMPKVGKPNLCGVCDDRWLGRLKLGERDMGLAAKVALMSTEKRTKVIQNWKRLQTDELRPGKCSKSGLLTSSQLENAKRLDLMMDELRRLTT